VVGVEHRAEVELEEPGAPRPQGRRTADRGRVRRRPAGVGRRRHQGGCALDREGAPPPDRKTITGKVTYGSLVNEPVTVAPPCACAPTTSSGRRHRRGPQDRQRQCGDRARPGGAHQGGPPDRLDLPCGHYYLQGFKLAGATAIVVHGRTAIYIDGDIDASAFLGITLDVKSELDLFVSGTIKASSTIKIGSANYPALSRTYVAEAAPSCSRRGRSSHRTSTTRTRRSSSPATTDMFGSVFAGDFEATATTSIHYDRQVVKTVTCARRRSRPRRHSTPAPTVGHRARVACPRRPARRARTAATRPAPPVHLWELHEQRRVLRAAGLSGWLLRVAHSLVSRHRSSLEYS